MKIKAVLIAVASLFTLNSYAAPALTLTHVEGSASITDISVWVMTLDGEYCFQRENISKLTQRIQIEEKDLTCDKQDVYAVYASIPGYMSGRYMYLGDKYPRHGGGCTIQNDKDTWMFDKLTIKCG